MIFIPEVRERMFKILKLISIILAITILVLPVLGESNSGGSGSSDSGGSSSGSADSGSSSSGSVDSGSSSSSSADSGSSSSGSAGSGKSDSKSVDSGQSGPNNEKAKEMYDSGSKLREDNGVSGMGFMQREDGNYGDYVTFSVDKGTGDVLNYGIAGTSLFDSIKIPGFDFKDSITKGAETKVVSKDGSIVIHIHDNPAAVMDINTDKKTNLIFNLASGVTATKEDNMVKITSRNETAYIVSEKASSISLAGRQVSIDTPNGNTIFRASPANMPHDDMEGRFMGEMMKNRAGAEVSVGRSDNYSIVNYSEDINVTMGQIESNHMRMEINSSNHSGKYILMNIDNSSLKWKDGQNVNLYLDNKSIKEVQTESELYNASESSYWLNKTGNNKMQAMMYIKDFSTHQVDIVVAEPATPTPTTVATTVATTTATPKTPGFGIMLGALCTIAVAYMMRRRL